MPTLLSFLIRLFLVAAGLLFAASLAMAAVLMLAVWAARAAWAKLTGRPVLPFIVRINPRGGFDRMYRRAEHERRPSAENPARTRQPAGSVTDVEYREPRT